MIKVMLIEDDPMVREINLKFTNKIEGFQVTEALGNVDEAKAAVLKNKPDLILLDIFLTSGNGLEYLKWLRQKEINVDVVLITADKSSFAVQEAFRYGAVDYLVKPFTFARFSEALKQYETRYDSIQCTEQVKQETIDKVILKQKKSKEVIKETSLPKGLSSHTYNQILDFVKNKKSEFTAEQLADEIGIARVTVRRYLDYLAKENKLQVDIGYGKIGRPTHFYKLK
jgi:two-component system CitB family response regulator